MMDEDCLIGPMEKAKKLKEEVVYKNRKRKTGK